MIKDPFLFDDNDLPEFPSDRGKNFRSIEFPLWSEEKAKLIQEYLRLFTFITKHGTYIDGFAAPQRRETPDLCSASLVLSNQPKWIRKFLLCDMDKRGAELLREIAERHRAATQSVDIIEGDFNIIVSEILSKSGITEKTATFALLDQRTFECSWETVKKIACHKSSLNQNATKIEIFYFLASGWLDRSIAAVRKPETASKLDAWWGSSNWSTLRGMQSVPRANLVAQRFKEELNYRYVHPFAIHNKKRKGRTMYHMIHATDHEEAPLLMVRAYRKVSGRPDASEDFKQTDMDALWRDVI